MSKASAAAPLRLAIIKAGDINCAFLHAHLLSHYGTVENIQQAPLEELPIIYNTKDAENQEVRNPKQITPLIKVLLERLKAATPPLLTDDLEYVMQQGNLFMLGCKSAEVLPLMQRMENIRLSHSLVGIKIYADLAKGHLLEESSQRLYLPSTHPLLKKILEEDRFCYLSGLNFAAEILQDGHFNVAVAAYRGQYFPEIMQALAADAQPEQRHVHCYPSLQVDGQFVLGLTKNAAACAAGYLLQQQTDSNVCFSVRKRLYEETVNLARAVEALKTETYKKFRQDFYQQRYRRKEGEGSLYTEGKSAIPLDGCIAIVPPPLVDVEGTINSNRSRNATYGSVFNPASSFEENFQRFVQQYMRMNYSEVSEAEYEKISKKLSVPEGIEALKYLPALCLQHQLDFQRICPVLFICHTLFFPNLYQKEEMQTSDAVLEGLLQRGGAFLQPLSLLYTAAYHSGK